MSNENKEFYDLLNSLIHERTFTLPLASSTTNATCKVLTTAQLKELVETVVDSPLTQAFFNSTATRIFEQSLVNSSELKLNIVDRLLFLLETRINSLSPTTTIKEKGETHEVDFSLIKANLQQKIQENSTLFQASSAAEGKIAVEFGPALLRAETQLNEEIYKNSTPNVEDFESLRKVLGDAFINEIAKTLRSVTIEDKTLDLSTVTFKSRLKTVESLPASLIQKVIEYIENYKKIIDECLTLNEQVITIDGSLFSLR